MLKKATCCFMIPLLLISPMSNMKPRLTEQLTDTEEVKLDLNLTNSTKDYLENALDKELKLLKEKKQEKERLERLEEERLRQSEESASYIDFELTFYTFKECVGGRKAKTCHGDTPYQGIVASNVYPQGTIIHLENWGEVLVWDRGGSNFNNSNRLDVFLEPLQGESLEDCSKRAFELGHIFTKGYIKE